MEENIPSSGNSMPLHLLYWSKKKRKVGNKICKIKFCLTMQVLKDCVMAATIKKGLDEQSSDDTALVIGEWHFLVSIIDI